MAQIVAIHGIGQQFRGSHVLQHEWHPAILSGLALAGACINNVDLEVAFYGDLFRPPGRTMSIVEAPYAANDIDNQWEVELLMAWWEETARVDSRVLAPDTQVMARAPRSIQRALDALSSSHFFVGLGERSLIGNLKQVRRYFDEPELRAAIQARIERCITEDTHVMIGHSLGSIVAYEALCAHPRWPVRTLVTLGSPLGVRKLIFDRLRPPPRVEASGQLLGVWPSAVEHWINVADIGDVVALVKDLRPLFGQRVLNLLVHNGAHAHDIQPYLTAKEPWYAIAAALK
jgi:hypothetical protein